MSIPIPVYSNPCLVSSRVPSIFYLAGVPEQYNGLFETHSIDLSHISSPIVTALSHNRDTQWSSTTPKYCSPYLGDQVGNTNSPFHVQQLSATFPGDTNVYPNGTTEEQSRFRTVVFDSPKNYAIVGASESFSFALAFGTLNANRAWLGVLLNGTTSSSNDFDSVTLSILTSTPLLTVGTYIASAFMPALGYSIVFDRNGGGMIFSMSGVISNATEYLQLGTPQPVEMTGITLSSKAFAINLADTAYIFDQDVKDGSLVLYSINPSQSAALQRVTMAGTPPPFAQYMTAAASNSHIALYSVTNSASRINMFDVSSRMWTGATPLYTSSVTLPSPTNITSPDASSSSAPLGAIIGGVVGGIVLIALVLFFVFRRRRGGYKKTSDFEPASQTIEFVDHEMPKLATNYVVMQPEPHQHQYQQNQIESTLPPPQDAYAMSPQTPYYNAHTDPNLVYAANSTQAPLMNIPVYHQVQPVVGVNPNSYLQPYAYSTPTVVSSHSSPTIFGARVAQENNQASKGSPLIAIESTPKIRGSPQATTTSADMPLGLLHPVPRNPQANN